MGSWSGLACLAVVACGLQGCAPRGRDPRSPAIVLPPLASRANLRVGFRADFPAPYALRRLVVVLDGSVVYVRAGDALDVPRTVFQDRVPEGEHTLSVLAAAVLPCGLTAKPRVVFELRGSHSFAVQGARGLAVTIRAGGRGSVTTSFDERMNLDFHEGRFVAGVGEGAWLKGAKSVPGCDDFDVPEP